MTGNICKGAMLVSALFLTLAAPAGEQLPDVRFPTEHTVEITTPAGQRRTISFDANTPADVTINLAAVRRHAAATKPE